MKNSLKDTREIDTLFAQKKAYYKGDLMFKFAEAGPKAGWVFAVSSKNFKRAVDRNRIKRMMREAFGGYKPVRNVAVVYVGKTMPEKIIVTKETQDFLLSKTLFIFN